MAGPHGTQAGQPLGDDGSIFITPEVADRLADSGAGWVRLNLRLGPHADDTAAFYADYDAIVDRLRARGLQIVGLMSNESRRGQQADWTGNSAEQAGGDGHNPFIED